VWQCNVRIQDTGVNAPLFVAVAVVMAIRQSTIDGVGWQQRLDWALPPLNWSLAAF